MLSLPRDFLLCLFFDDPLRRNLDLSRGIDNFNVLVPQDAENIIHLVGRHHVGRQRVVHFVVGQESFRLPNLDELLNFLPITILRRHRYLGDSAPHAVVPAPTPPSLTCECPVAREPTRRHA